MVPESGDEVSRRKARGSDLNTKVNTDDIFNLFFLFPLNPNYADYAIYTILQTMTELLSPTGPMTRSKTKIAKATPPGESRLLALPVELKIQIFRSCPSFTSASRLARTSKHLYGVWNKHINAIYSGIAPVAIKEHSALCDMLKDFERIPSDSRQTEREHLISVVEASSIGREFVDTYHVNMPAQPYRDPQVSQVLSPSEERRFVRAHYQILGLLCIDKAAQKKRIEQFNLKTLFLLSDFLCVFDVNGSEDEQIADMLERHPIAYRYLQVELRQRRNKIFRELYNHGYRPRSHTPFEANGRYAWWCDRQQETLREMLTGRVFRGEKGEVEMSKVRDDMWYDSDAE